VEDFGEGSSRLSNYILVVTILRRMELVKNLSRRNVIKANENIK